MLLLLEVFGGGLFLDGMKRELVEEIKQKFPNNFLPRIIDVRVSMDLPEGKLASFEKGIITVHPKTLGDREFLRYVLMHELIHASFGDCCGNEGHHWGFHKIADELGLPDKYRD